MKLAIITTHAIQYYAPVFKALAGRGISLKVFYTWGAESLQKYDPGFGRNVEWDIPLLEGYRYEFLKNTSPNPGTTHFRGIINPDAIKVIDSFNPDVILVYGWAWHSHLKIMRHYAGKKRIWFRGDSTLLDAPRGYKKLIRYIFLRWVYRHVNLAFYVGTQNKAYFKHFGMKDAQLKFAPHSIDNNRFSPTGNSEANKIRKDLNISSAGIVVLFAGKLEPKKDPFTLLEAFEELDDDNVFLLFAGNGVLEEELKRKAAQSAKKNKILFLDFQNQGTMPAIYGACQLFCLPSVGPGETWGLAVNEAMAAGKAVLVSNKVGCSIDLVRNGVNGGIFEAGNVKELSDKIKDLTKNPEKLRRMGEASAEIIENWSFNHQVAPILDEMEKVC